MDIDKMLEGIKEELAKADRAHSRPNAQLYINAAILTACARLVNVVEAQGRQIEVLAKAARKGAE